jgi:phosphoenolpyruvate carboxylase
MYVFLAAKGNALRVVPLFETLNDLNNAPTILTTLFSVTNYVGTYIHTYIHF